MRHEDIPPANEYERGVVANRRKHEAPMLESKIGRVAVLEAFVTRLLNLDLPFTRLKISSLDHSIRLDLQRIPGRVKVFPMTLDDERKEKLEGFCTSRGLESFAEYLGFDPWSIEPIVGFVFKGGSTLTFAMVAQLLILVYGANEDDEFHFVLM